MKFDPRTKLFIIAVLTAVSVFAPSIFYLLGILFVTLVFDIILKVNFLTVLKRLKFLLSAIVFVSLIQSLTIKGEPLITINGFTLISYQGLMLGLEFLVRMSIIIFASAIALTSSGKEMTDALIRLKFPYEVAFMVSTAISFLPMFREEFLHRVTAVKLRGIDIKKLPIGKKFKVYAFVLSPAVVGGAIKSRALADSMTAKAFRAHSSRTMLRELKLKPRDFIAIILVALLMAGFFATLMIIG
ncbi:MAG: energy-coupling factor transporter transmembrane protein EcfT [Firmicutes bacterium]|nr:energy-coupling factor transporter transmembrane protein EcfT [Bacillota bacterium]